MKRLTPLLFISFIFVIATGCKKHQEKKEQQKLEDSIKAANLDGLYQWEYSLKEGGEAAPDLPDHYGVIITTSGHFHFYKNNELQFSGNVTGINTNDPENTIFYVPDQLIHGNLNDSTLTLKVEYQNEPKIPYCSYFTTYIYDGNYINTTHSYTNYFKKL